MSKENILKNSHFKCRVSSVIGRNIKEYGKQFLFDDQEDTCWNSEQGLPQWIDLDFIDLQTISGIRVQFQGGFVGQDCVLQGCGPGEVLQIVQSFYPEDINAMQTFTLDNQLRASHIRLVFNKSTDFFGRIVVYKLEIVS